MKTYVIDIDGVLCDREMDKEHLGKKKYEYCYPLQENIDIVNALYEAGNRIILFTSRGMTVYNGNVQTIYRELFSFTAKQMRTYGVKFHSLLMGKPHYDIIVDDKALNVTDIKKLLNS